MKTFGLVGVLMIGVGAMIAADIELGDYQAELACWAVILALVAVLHFARRQH